MPESETHTKPGRRAGLFFDAHTKQALRLALIGPDEERAGVALTAIIEHLQELTPTQKLEVLRSTGLSVPVLARRWKARKVKASHVLGIILDSMSRRYRDDVWEIARQAAGLTLPAADVIKTLRGVDAGAATAVMTAAAVLAQRLGGKWIMQNTPSGISVTTGSISWLLRSSDGDILINGVCAMPCEVTGMTRIGPVKFSQLSLELCQAFADKHGHVTRQPKQTTNLQRDSGAGEAAKRG